MKKLYFTLKNVINCVHCEPALWEQNAPTFCPEITGRINSYHWLSFLEAQCYTHHICVYRSHTCVRLLGFKQVCSWLSTCFRHAFDLLATCFRHAHASRKPGLQPGLQLARIMECGLKPFY